MTWDPETCSWCTAQVPYDSLREVADGAMVCRACHADAQESSEVYIGLGTGHRYTGKVTR